MNFYSDSSEWQYLFKNGIDWDTIIPLYKSSFPTSEGFEGKDDLLAFYEELLITIGKWSGDVLAPRARELDRVGGGQLVEGRVEISEVLKKTYKEAKEMDLFGTSIDQKFEGMGLPATISLLGFELLSRACVATSTQLGFFTSMADMLERFCDADLQEKYIPKILKGEVSGSMCLTEPDCGSDLGAIRTSAEKQPDGTYLLNGSKCFITNGGGGVAFILARVKGAPAGLDGLSMFFADEWMDDPQSASPRHNYRVSKIEEKMGMHGSVTCEVLYENTSARLVGQENDGFKLMLYLMNEARISVGLQGLGGIEAAIGASREYAETRKAFGSRLIDLPLFKRNLEDWETERDAFRALMVDTISYFDIFQKLDSKKRHTHDLNEDESHLFKKATYIVRRRTPLVKFYGAEANTRLSQRAIQAFGGYGFITEYDVERWHRDSFGALLYEGTSQIQALMAMKDFIKDLVKDPKKYIQSLLIGHPILPIRGESEAERKLRSVIYEFRKNVTAMIIRSVKPDLDFSENGIKKVLGQFNQVFKKGYWEEANRYDKMMSHAETLCEALAYSETLKVLCKHATRDSSREKIYYRYLNLVTPRLAGIYADWKI